MTLQKVLLLVMTISCGLTAQPKVVVDLSTKHVVGGISEFDRSKYVVMHSSITSGDWLNEEEKLEYLLDDLDVYFGRDNGVLPYYATQITEDPNRPGYADPNAIKAMGHYFRTLQYGSSLRHRHKFEDKLHMMLGGQLSQFWIGNHKGKGGWTFKNTDAVGEFVGLFFNEYYREQAQGPEFGPQKPKYFEVLNEPLYDLVTVHKQDPLETFIYHNEVADALRKVNSEVKVGGYTTAFPWFDDNNFQRWHQRMKLFIDTSGEQMDFFSIHLYDFGHLNRDGGVVNFRGGRIEATMDMMEQYELLALGDVKPFLISEYGGRDHITEQTPWTPLNDWQTMKSFTPMMLQFMAKPDQIIKAIPFSLTKAEWSGNGGRDYAWRLLRHNDEKAGESGEHYVFTDIIKFYQQWQNVRGTRVDSYSTEADLLVDSYVDGNKAYVIVANLVTGKQNFNLHVGNAGLSLLKELKAKQVHFVNGAPHLSEVTFTEPLLSYTLDSEASVIFEYTFNNDVAIKNQIDESKYYANSYLKPIKANSKISFDINGVEKSEHGEGVLRVSFGREHQLSKKPTVTINGHSVDVPTDFAGDEQSFRPQFFSMLEIPVPLSILRHNNAIEIVFEDTGGYVTTATLQVFQSNSDSRNVFTLLSK